MRIILTIFLFFSLSLEGQVIRANSFYRPSRGSCQYPLDTYSGAFTAFSTRKLRSSYSGPAIRILRTSDNAEQDIGFVGCELDTTAIKTFIGSSDGLVVKAYDQTGNSRDAYGIFLAELPKIATAGVIERLNNKPTIRFDGSNDVLVIDALDANNRVDLYYIASTSDNQYLHFYDAQIVNQFTYVATDGSGSTLIYQNIGTPSFYINNNLFTGTTRDNVHDQLNGTKVLAIENMSTSGWLTNFRFCAYGAFQFNGHLPEFIAWTSDQSSNRSNIIASINTYWGVY